MALIDDIKLIIGNLLPDNTNNEISPEDVRDSLYAILDNSFDYVRLYSTYAEMTAADGSTELIYVVLKDSNSSKNGYYSWAGSAYVKDSYTEASLLTKQNGNINVAGAYFEESTKVNIKFDILYIRGISGNSTLYWDDVKTQLAGQTFETSPKGIDDCLLLPPLKSIVYDLEDETVKVIDRSSREAKHYILFEADHGFVNSGSRGYQDYLLTRANNNSHLVGSPFSSGSETVEIIGSNKIKFKSKLYIYYNNALRTLTPTSPLEFTMAKDDYIYVDTSVMTSKSDSSHVLEDVVKKGSGGIGTFDNNFIILTVYYNAFFGGLLADLINRQIVYNQTYISPNSSGVRSFKVKDNKLTFTGPIYVYYREENYRLDLQSGPLEFTFNSDDYLVLNVKDLVGTAYPGRYIEDYVEKRSGGFGTFNSDFVLLTYRYFDYWFGGAFEDMITQQLMLPVLNSTPITTESRFKHLTNHCANQGLSVLRSEVWHFEAAPDDNSSFANILRFEESDLSAKVAHTHNLGHAASIDYNNESDILAVGNGSGDTGNKPRLDMVLNISSLLGGSTQAIDINGANVLSIPFFTAYKEIGGSGLIAAFGEDRKTMYLLTGQGTAPRKIFKVKLGYGSEDLSDPGGATGTDVTKWGAFLSGKSENELNGTAEILSTYTGVETGVYQGVAYFEDSIYLCCGFTEPRVHKIKLTDDGYYRIDKEFQLKEYDANGALLIYEPEGVCIYKGAYLLLGVVGTSRHLSIMPLKNKQKGIGQTDIRVDFMYKNNATPNVTITPTSNVTDLYVSSIDSEGFTVSSSSSGIGSFYWESDIQ